MQVHTGKFHVLYFLVALKSAIGLWAILVRKDVVQFQTRLGPQCVAVVAFFSGMFFIKEPAHDGIICHFGYWLIVAAVVQTSIALLNLCPSFGVLIARREIRSSGLYGMCRHPMYASELVKRLGFILLNPCGWNIGFALVTGALYVWRANVEEAFLQQTEDYRNYRLCVPWRFFPGIW